MLPSVAISPEAHCPSTVAPAEERFSHSDWVMQVPVRSLLALGVQESCLKVRMLKMPNSPAKYERRQIRN